ncbi:hypothetical protein EZV61_15770 [Corallincola luteus]|uniref:Lipoprotein n=1 Tax=Corallincola luteus TaxID=1775177 RepID=A0ABY2AHH0_9GAMM|nr:hypothetical protein [Corallincola luteus]TCI02031.1 hypothetical protein EZV61_15770 [Corallincola luteus]
MRLANKIAVLVVAMQWLSACTSNVYLATTPEDAYPGAHSKIMVHVTNADHPDYIVLKRSHIYELSDDDTSQTKLTLHAPDTYPTCGNGIFGTLFTLGLIPIHTPIREDFTYTLEENENSTRYRHSLNMYEATSIWEWLYKPFAETETDVRANALAVSNRESPRF